MCDPPIDQLGIGTVLDFAFRVQSRDRVPVPRIGRVAGIRELGKAAVFETEHLEVLLDPPKLRASVSPTFGLSVAEDFALIRGRAGRCPLVTSICRKRLMVFSRQVRGVCRRSREEEPGWRHLWRGHTLNLQNNQFGFAECAAT